MKKRLDEPVALIAMGLAISALVGLTTDRGDQPLLLGAGLLLAAAGGVWWLVKAHAAEHRRKKVEASR